MKLYSMMSFICRYLSNGASCLKNEKKSLKGNYEDLRNSLDLVGFTDEVSCMSVWQLSFDHCLIVIGHWSILSFFVFVSFSDTINNRSTICINYRYV